MRKIFTLGYQIDSPNVVNLQFNSKETLLDADIVVIDASVYDSKYFQEVERYYTPDQIEDIYDWRRKEIMALLQNGKIIFIWLSPVHFIRKPGTGYKVSNYHWLPYSREFITKILTKGEGSEVTLRNPDNPIAPYFRAFKNELKYTVYFTDDRKQPDWFLVNRVGYPVGFTQDESPGLLAFVPPPPPKVAPEKLIGVLIQCAEPLLTKDFRTPEPEWAKEYDIPGVDLITKKITAHQTQLEAINVERERLEQERNILLEYRSLLFEKGKPLEVATLRALRLLGFKADKFSKGDMDHDAILEAPEGRAIAEIEGKDNEAISIDKLDQLTRVMDEDFHERGTYSEGLLIGNPYRVAKPENRNEPFTEKVLIAAKRKGVGLLTTTELFRAVVKILENPQDEAFKEICRRKILTTKGEIISFYLDR